MKFITYNNYRNNIKNGDLYFTHTNDIFSILIRLVTAARVSHVGIFFWIEERLFIGEEMQGRGCRMMLGSERFGDDSILIVSPPKVPKDLVNRVLRDVGRVPYDILGVFLAPFYRLNTSKKDCAEWVSSVLDLNIRTGRGVYPEDVLLKVLKNK